MMADGSYIGVVTKKDGTTRDQDVVRWIKTLINKGGIPVKTLDDLLIPGISISAMEHSLVHNARCVFVVVSNDFLTTSGKHHTQLGYAISAHMCMPLDRIFLIPVLSDHCHEAYERNSRIDKITPLDASQARSQEEFEEAFFVSFGFARGRAALAITHQ